MWELFVNLRRRGSLAVHRVHCPLSGLEPQRDSTFRFRVRVGSLAQLSRGEEGGRGKKYVLNYRYIFSLLLRSHSKKDVSPLLSPRKPFNPPNHLRCPCRAPPDQTSYSSAVVSPTKSGIDRIWLGGVRAVGVRASALKRLTLIRNHHVSFALWVFGRHSVCLSFSERLNRRTIL